MKGKLNRLLPMVLVVAMLFSVTACNSGETAVDSDAETVSETAANATEGITKTQTEGVTERIDDATDETYTKIEQADHTTIDTYAESEAVSEMITLNSTETVTEMKNETQDVAPSETTERAEEITVKSEVVPEEEMGEKNTAESAEESVLEPSLPAVTETENESEVITERPQAPTDMPMTEIVTENNKDTTAEPSEKVPETESETERKEETTEDIEITEENLPWNNGGKLPTEYTASEFYELSTGMRFYFMEWFESTEVFDEWLIQAEEQEVVENLPWNNGGKLPFDYTASEFHELDSEQQHYFIEWFESTDVFDEWLIQAEEQEAEGKLPWNNGGKLPSDYTASEFYELSAEQRFYFMEWFENAEAFDKWLIEAEEKEASENLPWNNGGKLPSEYTLAEFHELSAEQRYYFMEWFESTDAFDEWLFDAEEKALKDSLPWNNGGKLPSEYTLSEFYALSAEQRHYFMEWFGSDEAFDTWLQKEQQ